MSAKHTEPQLEDTIEYCLLHQHGYLKGKQGNYHIASGLGLEIRIVNRLNLKTHSTCS